MEDDWIEEANEEAKDEFGVEGCEEAGDSVEGIELRVEDAGEEARCSKRRLEPAGRTGSVEMTEPGGGASVLGLLEG